MSKCEVNDSRYLLACVILNLLKLVEINASQQEEGLGWKVSVSPVEGGWQPLLGGGGGGFN